MAMCHLCRRNLLLGERYRLWTGRGVVGERAVCRLCEEHADHAGWMRVDQPLQHERGSSAWHVRKVA